MFDKLFLFHFLIGVIEGTSLESVLKRVHKDFVYDDRCDGLICDEFVCVPNLVICDKQVNCQDGTDELFCPCPLGYFQCWNGKQCVPGHLLCDGAEDCDDASDERFELCEEEGSGIECSEEMMKCDENSCIEDSKRCDGVLHCGDQADEENCDTAVQREEDLSFEEPMKTSKSSKIIFNLNLLLTFNTIYTLLYKLIVSN